MLREKEKNNLCAPFPAKVQTLFFRAEPKISNPTRPVR